MNSSPANTFSASRFALRLLCAGVAALGAMLGTGQAQVTINEDFRGTTAPGWVFSSSSGTFTPTLTANTVDTPGTGWLQLTQSVQNQATSALFDNQIFSVNAQIDITMEYTFWNGHNNLVQDGTGADGITFFLVDASKNAANFAPGAYGGSLGYAQKTVAGGGGVDAPGMAGGYLGFGFDNWGNFSGSTEGRVGGIGNSVADGATNGYPNRIVVRGPDDYDGNNATGWNWIASSTTLSSSMDFPLSTTRPDDTGANYRAFHLTLDANNQLTVQMQFGTSGTFSTVFTADLAAYQRPDNFKIGFTAGTGNADETHEVRNVSVAMTPFQAGAYEWDNGAGTTAWGVSYGGTNTNWYNSVTANNDHSPTQDSDILFANRPSSGPQTVSLSSSVQVRSLTFDTSYNYSLTGSGVITLGSATVSAGLPSINVNDYNGAQAHHHINNALVVVEDLRINNYSFSTLCLNGGITLGGNDITVNGTGAVNFNSAITGTTGSTAATQSIITKNGAGILTINADSSAGYHGNFVLNSGQTVVTVNGALGSTTGTTAVNSGATLTFRGGVTGVNYTTAEAVTISGDGWAINGHPLGAIYNDGGNNSFSGAITLAANSSIGSRDGTLTLSGVITDGAGTFSLTKLGAGTVALTGTNTYDGATIIQGGALRVTAASLPGGFATGAPSGGNLQLNGGVLELADGTTTTFSRTLGTGADQVQFTGDGGFSAFGGARSVSLSGGVTLTWASTAGFLGNGSTLILGSTTANNTVDFQNAIALNGALRTIRVDDGSAAVDAKLSGALSGTGASGISKTGAGTLELTGSNTYSGATEIKAGALRITGASSLSTNSNLQLNGGVLELNNANYTNSLGTGANAVQFTGDGGFAAVGAARTVNLGNAGATLIWGSTGSFLANGKTLILGSASADNTLTFANGLNLNGAAQTIRVQDGTAAIDAQLTGVLSNGSLTVTGSGTLTSTAANTLADTLSVSGAEFRLRGAGTALSLSSLVVQKGGTFTLDNSGTNTANRLKDTATISLSGGTLQLLGISSASTTESVGAITLVANSDNTINIAPGATNRSATLTISSLARDAGATVNFNNSASTDTFSTGSTTPKAFITSAPTLTNGILAYATVENDSFATTSSNFIVAATTTTTSLNSAAATDNVGVTAATISVSANRTINSLRLDTNSTVTISPGVTLTLSSGGLLARSGFADTITGGTITVGTTSLSQELFVFTAPSSTLSISSVIADNGLGGTVGITKADTGTLILTGTTANTLTGNTTVNGGTLQLAKTAGVTALAGNISVGDFRGQDKLQTVNNLQFAGTLTTTTNSTTLTSSTTVTLHGTDAANRATLDLGDTTQAFSTLTIDGNAVLDFSGGTVCAPSYLYLDDLLIPGGSILLIKNWIEFTDFLLVKNTSTSVTPELGRIQFEGYGEAAAWIPYDSNWSQICPVPEPATYGAIFLGGGLAFVLFRRRRAAKTVALNAQA